MPKVDLYYFSGTGNTLIICQRMKNVFESKGIRTRLLRIENEDPKNVIKDNIIGLAFPVAIFSTYPIVVNFIKNMPKTEGAKVFMLDTMGGLSLGLVSHIGAILRKKGYRTIGAKEFVMPDNFTPSVEKDIKNPSIIDKAMIKADKYVDKLLKDQAKWFCLPVLPSIIFNLSQIIFKIPDFRKKSVKMDLSRCVKCGLCARLCPVKNIVIREYPVFLDKCELCMRCIAFCSAHALYRGKQGEHRYRAVNNVDFS